MKKVLSPTNYGFTIVETLLASALFFLILVFSVGAIAYSTGGTLRITSRGQAMALAEEAVEAIYSLEGAHSGTLADGTYGLNTSLDAWALDATPDTQNGFTRTIVITTQEDQTQKIEVTITWDNGVRNYGSIVLVSTLAPWQSL